MKTKGFQANARRVSVLTCAFAKMIAAVPAVGSKQYGRESARYPYDL